ncbi:MAG: DUF3179 domain-containing (seleno)protein [Planctomycetota bacterium]
MRTQDTRSAGVERIRLDIRGGGWVLVVALALMATVVAWRLPTIWNLLKERGRSRSFAADTNGFLLSPLLVPRGRIVRGMAREGARALTSPGVLSAAEVAARARSRRNRTLLGPDRVIGVAIGSEARAYPIRILSWHEVVNDELGGVPIAVTYSPLSDSVAVFERRRQGEVLEFGVSGLLLDAHLLLFDRRAVPEEESLWSQLRRQAISGPAAASGEVLRVIPARVLSWRDWLEAHPVTTVMRGDPAYARQYKSDPYVSYYGSGIPRHPVSPLPDSRERPLMTPMIIVRAGGEERAYAIPEICELAADGGTWDTVQGQVRLTFHSRRHPTTAWLDPAPSQHPPEVTYAFWFAWYATNH